MSKTAVVVLAEGFEEIEAVAPIDVLRRAGVQVTIAGLDGKERVGAHGVPYRADVELSELSGDFDLVIFPGGMPGSKNLGDSSLVRALAERNLKAGRRVAAICAAPVLTLGAWGMLDGKTATCYPGMENMFPATVTFSAERVVVDGLITTSRGPGTALEFGLNLAGQLVGNEMMDKLKGDMVIK